VVRTFHVDVPRNAPVNPESHIALIVSDICSHILPVPLIGAIALGGPLCVATAVKTLKPKLLELLRKFVSPDAATALETRVDFINACFADPENVPFADKAAWTGSTVLQGPNVTTAISAGHKPDQTELVALGAQGFPAMILYGTEDQIQDGAVGAAEARPYFTDLEVAAIEGGSHSVFYDNLDETVGHILAFCLRVNGQVCLCHCCRIHGSMLKGSPNKLNHRRKNSFVPPIPSSC
jgi:pimeloyl-ACP methyl ester carboxylesterase